jgi:sulfane dehydrogenase subunit SoxC
MLDKHLGGDTRWQKRPKTIFRNCRLQPAEFLKRRAGTWRCCAGRWRCARGTGDPLITEIQDWNQYLGDGVDANPYGTPSEFEADVVRRNVPWLTADPVSSINFTPLHELDGIITPNGLCFERHHGGTAVDPAEHRLMINGLVDTPLVFTMEDLMRFPRENHVYFLECAANSGMEWRGAQLNGCQFTHGMVHNVMYTGVPLRYLLEEAGVKTNGKWVAAGRCRRLGDDPLDPDGKGLDDCLVAFKMNGEALRAEQGYPLRLVVPGWEGNMWVKWLRRSKWAMSRGTTARKPRSTPTFWPTARPGASPGRWTQSPSSPARARRRRSPTEGADWSSPAWRGRQRHHHPRRCVDRRRQELAEARIDGPSLDKSLHRFYLDFDWDGSDCCCSRARWMNRLCTADQERASRRAWREFDLSQQWYPDLAREGQW